MTRFISYFLSLLIFVSGSAFCAEKKNEKSPTEEQSLKDIPEPIKCYGMISEVTGDEGMTVGLGVRLCAGTQDAKATLLCYKMAFESLSLNRGLAVELCGSGRKLD